MKVMHRIRPLSNVVRVRLGRLGATAAAAAAAAGRAAAPARTAAAAATTGTAEQSGKPRSCSCDHDCPPL
eukprot:3031955-Pleurochrysis_carterae.AAC.2